jgi:5-oxoprolinase (ATP-hydrolysing)/N-methylhydantoinase A
VHAPEGSILNCRYPAPVGVRTMTGWHCAPALFAALAPVLPEQVQAFTGLPLSIGAYGAAADGRSFNDHLFQGGGQGASAHGDGKHALLYPTSAANTSVELFEVRTPPLHEQKAQLPDSGGAGRQRGGLGQTVRLRKLYDDDLPVLLSLSAQGMLSETPGLFGGHAGRRAWLRLEEGVQAVEGVALGSLVELRRPEQRLTVELGGGSGYGPPAERPLDQVQEDVDTGLITAAGAASYGCDVDAAGRVRRHAAPAQIIDAGQEGGRSPHST